MAASRQEALTVLADGGGEVDRLLARLSEDELTRPRTIGGGDWSAGDLLGHIAHWEELAVAAMAEWRAGRVPWIETVFGADDVDGAVDNVNAENARRSAGKGLDELRARAAAAHAALLAAITDMSDEEWASRAPYPTERRRTLGELLGSVTGAPKRAFGHAFAHLDDLRAYVSEVDAKGS